MGLESATYINQLDVTNPLNSDPKSAGDDHIRMIKRVLKETFPAITGPVLATQDELNSGVGGGGGGTLNQQLTILSGMSVQQATDVASISALIGTMMNDATQTQALLTLGSFFGGVISRTSAYTVTTADRGKLVEATTGSWTVSFPGASTAGAGFSFAVANSGSGTITLDPSETIDGAGSITLTAGQSCIVVSNGSAWRTVGRTVSSSGSSGVLLGCAGGLGPLADTATRPTGATKALLVLQGGGGNGATLSGNRGGGGGSGAYTEIVVPVSSNITFNIGGQGEATSISGTGFTTVTVAGGGNASGATGGTGGETPTHSLSDRIALPGTNGANGSVGGIGGSGFRSIGGVPWSGISAGANGQYGGGGSGAYNSATPGTGGVGYAIVYWYA